LYDQAMLAMAYTEAYQATHKSEYRTTAERVFEYVLRDINGSVGTQGAENGIVQMLGQMFNDRFSAFLTKSEYDQLHQNLNGQRTGSIGIAIEGRCDSGVVCPSGQPATEVVIEDAGHGPHLDQPEQFLAELTDHLAGR